MAEKFSGTDDVFFDDLTEEIEYYTVKKGMTATDAQIIASTVVKQIRERYAGIELYLKKGRGAHPAAARIRAEFNGSNLTEIMERYHVSRTTVYKYRARQK